MPDQISNTDIYSIQCQSKIFCEIGQILTSSLNPTEVFKRVMKLIGEYFSPRNWSLLLMEENTGRLKFEIVLGLDESKLKKFYIPKGEGIAGWVCEHGQPAIVEDVSKDPRFSPIVDQFVGFVTRSVVCVPLLNANKRVIGAIELINKIAPPPEGSAPESPPVLLGSNDAPFSILDMEILAAIGAFTGIAAENAFLHQKVKELAMIDPLTGIYNRYYFTDILKREEKRIKRFEYSICILMMDVDGLKSINDSYGHIIGDKVLCHIASILKASVRESDVLARFGGDEFIILMPNSDATDGANLATRIQQAIEDANRELSDSEPKRALSIGVYASGTEDLNQVLRLADLELYQNKFIHKKYEDLISEEQMRAYLWYNYISDDE